MKTKHRNDTKSHTYVVYLTLLTGPLRIQLWSQDIGSYTKINRERTLRLERTKRNKTNKQQGRKQTEESGRENSLQRTSSPGRDSGGKNQETEAK